MSKDCLVVASKVKAYIKSKGFLSSSDVIDGISACVARCLDEAMKRAKDNGRKTVRAQDI
jgi:histone H3/H4